MLAAERPAPARRGLQTFSSLRHADFRLLWTTSLLNSASNWLQQVTLGWLAYDLTGSPLVAGAVFGIRSLPQLLVGPIGGVIGDRFERKRGLLVNSAYMSALAIGFAALLALGDVKVWHLLLFTTLQGFGQALVAPVRQALVANTVPSEDLMNAIALNSFAFSVMRVIGPAIAGVLIVLSGPALNFGIQGVVFSLTLLLVLPMKTPYRAAVRRASHETFADSFVQGVRYLRRQPTILGLTLLGLGPAFFTTPINLGLLPVFARDALDVDANGLGALYSMQGVGAVLATLTIASLGNYRHKGKIVAVAALGNALAIAIYSQVTIFWLALPFLATATCCFTAFSTASQTIIQTLTPDEYRGRVMGLHMMDHGLTPLGSLIAGVLAEVFGVATAVLVAGSSGLVFVIVNLVVFPSIRTYRSGAPVEVATAGPAAPAVREAAVPAATSD